MIWVHPQKRFFVVEFRSAVTGETWRETVYFPLEPNGPLRGLTGYHRGPYNPREKEKGTKNEGNRDHE